MSQQKKISAREWVAFSIMTSLFFFIIPSYLIAPKRSSCKESYMPNKPIFFSYLRIKGAVQRPGIVRISQDMSLKDILDRQGALPNADFSKLELSKPVSSKKIMVPFLSN
jgi:hypothetical protein